MSIHRFFRRQSSLRNKTRAVAFLFGALLIYGCGGEESMDTPLVETVGDERRNVVAPISTIYYPMTVGNRWVYRNAVGSEWTREITETENYGDNFYHYFSSDPPIQDTQIESLKSPVYVAFLDRLDRRIAHNDMDADGTNMRKLTHNIGETDSPAWSPDGSSIAYQHNFQLWIMDSNGENKRQLTKRNNRQVIDSHPTWSPDSKHIVFDSSRNGERTELFLVSVESGSVNRLFPPHHHQNINNQADWYHPGPLSVSPVDTKVTIWGRLKSRK